MCKIKSDLAVLLSSSCLNVTFLYIKHCNDGSAQHANEGIK